MLSRQKQRQHVLSGVTCSFIDVSSVDMAIACFSRSSGHLQHTFTKRDLIRYSCSILTPFFGAYDPIPSFRTETHSAIDHASTILPTYHIAVAQHDARHAWSSIPSSVAIISYPASEHSEIIRSLTLLIMLWLEKQPLTIIQLGSTTFIHQGIWSSGMTSSQHRAAWHLLSGEGSGFDSQFLHRNHLRVLDLFVFIHLIGGSMCQEPVLREGAPSQGSP